MIEAGSHIGDWGLHGRTEEGGVEWRTPVHPLPFLVGRKTECQLRLRSPRVSSRHAELFARDGALWLRDLGSTNGTFVNGDRVQGERQLAESDIVHFADQEFRVSRSPDPALLTGTFTSTIQIAQGTAELGPKAIREVRTLLDAIRSEYVGAAYQAIVDLESGQVVAYEALGRVRHPDLPPSPGPLFQLADRLGLTLELSRAFRRRGLEEAVRLPSLDGGVRPRVFINSHPLEIPRSDELLADLREFRQRYPEERLVLEIHESAVTDPEHFLRLREELEQIGVGHAFDDFGSGEARLRELSEAAPELVKFDTHFARGVHEAPRRLEVVRTLVTLMKGLGIDTLIEGVETEEEVAACRALGFRYAQGYFFARPVPVEELENDDE